MESILAAISALAIISGITSWAFAWKINGDWQKVAEKMLEVLERENNRRKL